MVSVKAPVKMPEPGRTMLLACPYSVISVVFGKGSKVVGDCSVTDRHWKLKFESGRYRSRIAHVPGDEPAFKRLVLINSNGNLLCRVTG